MRKERNPCQNERFDKELSGLTADLMDMASMVNGVIRKTSEALEENDMKQAHRIQEGDVVINRFERHIEQTCLSLIKQESPIASDLRLITAALKIITDLERAADQCADICEIIERSGTHLAFGAVRDVAADDVFGRGSVCKCPKRLF